MGDLDGLEEGMLPLVVKGMSGVIARGEKT